nr:serine/threonine-protein kinase rad53 [Quercus suber]
MADDLLDLTNLRIRRSKPTLQSIACISQVYGDGSTRSGLDKNMTNLAEAALALSGAKRKAKVKIRKRNGFDTYKSEIVAMAKASRYPDSFVCFHGWFENESHIYLAMDFFPLGDLSLHIQQPLPEGEVREITLQLLCGLQIIHNMGFTHRDLKPQNILVARRWPPNWDIRLGDFGIAKRVLFDETELRTLVGTAAYMAPEMFPYLTDDTHDHGYSQTVDMWATGVLIFRMLTSHNPFSEICPLSRFVKGDTSFPELPLYLNHVSLAGTDLLKALLQPDATRRLTCEDALAHEWTTGVVDTSKKAIAAFEHTSDHVSTTEVSDASSIITSASERPIGIALTLEAQNEETITTPNDGKVLDVTQGGRPINAPSGSRSNRLQNIALSLDGGTLAIVRGREVSILDIASTPFEEHIICHLHSSTELSWLAHGTLALQIQSSVITLWTRRSQWKELKFYTGDVTHLAGSSDGMRLASVSSDKRIQIWDPVNGVALMELSNDSNGIVSLAFSPDSSILISSSQEDIKTWRTADGLRLRTFDVRTDVATTLAFAPDGRWIASASHERLQLWTVEMGAEVLLWNGASADIHSVAFSPDGLYLAWVSHGNIIWLYDRIIGVFSQRTYPEHLFKIIFSSDRRAVVIAGVSGIIDFWEVQSFHTLFTPSAASVRWTEQRQPIKQLKLFERLTKSSVPFIGFKD